MNDIGTHIIIFLGGATGFGIVAHAVQTFPTPQNKYGAWLLGAIQFAVGQRERAMNTMLGERTITNGVQLDPPATSKKSITPPPV